MLDSSLEALLPEGAVVTDVVPRGGGRSAVHEVRLAETDPVIVKRYDDRSRWLQTKEAYVYGLLAEHGVGPLPRVLRVDTERAVTLLTLLPGDPLSADLGLRPRLPASLTMIQVEIKLEIVCWEIV